MASPVTNAPKSSGAFGFLNSARVAGLLSDRPLLAVGSITAGLFVFLFYQPAAGLLIDWWTLPEAGHGLLLGPVAIW